MSQCHNGHIMQRSLESYIRTDLQNKIVFITGPRQCGKTTLSKMLNLTHRENYCWSYNQCTNIVNGSTQDSDLWILFDLNVFLMDPAPDTCYLLCLYFVEDLGCEDLHILIKNKSYYSFWRRIK